MGAAAIAFSREFSGGKRLEMTEYLSSEDGYWLSEDKWYMDEEGFLNAGIETHGKHWILADFEGYKSEHLKAEMKYYLLFSMKEKHLTANGINRNYARSIRNMGIHLGEKGVDSFENLTRELVPPGLSDIEKKNYLHLYHKIIRFVTEYYDGTPEVERDVWNVLRLSGVRQSAAERRSSHSMNFREIPEYYRPMVKRFLSRLIVRRSWSFSKEMLMYIRYFFRVFYKHGYTDGFFKEISRKDMEEYLRWVTDDYADKNATFRSKAVSYIRQFIDYIQLAEYGQAPQKDVNRLLFDDDVPRRERPADTMEKIKYIPGSVKEQLDASIQELEPVEMRPLYILLRESGWRGADILNLRYDSCLDYLWNGKEKAYVPYLCGEITKTGIPLHKIPIRQEVADMVKKLADEAAGLSTEDNNPEHYLFNTYGGKNKGLPYSKPAFTTAVRELIEKKGILDGDGNLYHFKAHSLRHTRAMEYTEQGMPIGIIQQVLGHCSLQMTLHYSKVSENMLYEKWKETESLGLLRLNSGSPSEKEIKEEGLHYEFVRKNLDAVKVPFGVCFKPSKLPCRQQMNHCLECANFCTSRENAAEYESEIERIKTQIELGRKTCRGDWIGKNLKYLGILEKMLGRIRTEGIVHKNGRLREDYNG